MNLQPIYIPFQSIFPNLAGFLASQEELSKHFPQIDPTSLYGQVHKGTSSIERKISQLHLIMHRLRVDSGINILSCEKHVIDFLYLPIDFESFFVWLRLIMDSVAYLTPLMYERHGIVPQASFNDQKKWFIEKRPSFDEEYSKYLEQNTEWFVSMRAVRDDALHRHYWSYAESKTTGEVKIKRMRGNKTEEEVGSLVNTIGDYYAKFVGFSKFYEEHFKSLLLSRDPKYSYHESKTEMVEQYACSINYFKR